MYWKTWSERGVYFVQDRFKNTGKYLSYEEFKTKYNIEINFIYYCQILSAIPKSLKLKAMTVEKPPETIIEESDVYQLCEGKTIRLSKMRCRDYYSLFQGKWETQPTSVRSWSKHYPSFANKWNNLFKNISKMSADNKLRQFSFKLLHKILGTKKELKRYKIKPDDECFFCKSPDSLEHTFLACSVAEDFYYEMMTWFNNEQKSQFNMTKQQILFNDFTLPIGSQHLLKWKFGIFITLMKKYIYDCKMMEKFPCGNQFKEKLNYQWKFENSGN